LLGGRLCRLEAAALFHRAPQPRARRRRDGRPLLRHLPLGHPPGARHAGRFDVLIDTVSARHELDSLFRLLKPFGALALVGMPPQAMEVKASSLVAGNKRFAGSSVGGMKETQELVDFCAAKGVLADVEVIPAESINEAYERVLKNDVRYRFVIDAKTL
jgi:uncharacterized zinc-type alcohol dehydrogenase-like protein